MYIKLTKLRCSNTQGISSAAFNSDSPAIKQGY